MSPRCIVTATHRKGMWDITNEAYALKVRRHFSTGRLGRGRGSCEFSTSSWNSWVNTSPALRKVWRCMKHSACSRRSACMLEGGGGSYAPSRPCLALVLAYFAAYNSRGCMSFHGTQPARRRKAYLFACKHLLVDRHNLSDRVVDHDVKLTRLVLCLQDICANPFQGLEALVTGVKVSWWLYAIALHDITSGELVTIECKCVIHSSTLRSPKNACRTAATPSERTPTGPTATIGLRTILTASSGNGTGTTYGLWLDEMHPMMSPRHAAHRVCRVANKAHTQRYRQCGTLHTITLSTATVLLRCSKPTPQCSTMQRAWKCCALRCSCVDLRFLLAVHMPINQNGCSSSAGAAKKTRNVVEFVGGHACVGANANSTPTHARYKLFEYSWACMLRDEACSENAHGEQPAAANMNSGERRQHTYSDSLGPRGVHVHYIHITATEILALAHSTQCEVVLGIAGKRWTTQAVRARSMHTLAQRSLRRTGSQR